MKKNTELSLDAAFQTELHTSLERTERLFETGNTKLFSKKLSLIKALAQLSSSGVTVYDIRQNRHIYTSGSFYRIFGYEIPTEDQPVNEVFDRRVHPLDLIELGENGTKAMHFLQSIPFNIRKDYKMINEYRISSKSSDYIRVIEQHQILEQDHHGNILLSLAVIDISPDQSKRDGVKSQMLNFATGELVQLPSSALADVTKITRREKEILEMIGDGFLSKEISGLLEISVHTVNTHRQNILEKLGADNAIEAVTRARHLNLIS